VGGHDGPAEPQCVEVATVRDEACAQVVPACAAHPRCGWLSCGLCHQRIAQLIARRDCRQVRPTRVERRDRQVVMGVDEAWAERLAAQVLDHRAGERVDHRTPADGGDTVALDDDRLDGAATVHGQDATPDERAHC
jgi:hypothetical protein